MNGDVESPTLPSSNIITTTSLTVQGNRSLSRSMVRCVLIAPKLREESKHHSHVQTNTFLLLYSILNIDINIIAPTRSQYAVSSTMDNSTAKKARDVQDQLTAPSTRKRKREDANLEDGLKSPMEHLTLSNKKRPKAIPKGAQKCKKCAELSKKDDQLEEDIKQLKVDNKLQKEATKEHKASLRKLYDGYDELEQENEALKAKLKKLEKDEIISKNDFGQQEKSQPGT